MVAAAAAVVLIVWPTLNPETEDAFGETRSKGGPSIGFFVKRGEETVVGESGQAVHPGDVVRFTYSSGQETNLAIVSLDGAQRVSVYQPSTTLPAASQSPLEGAVELDDVVGDETVFAVFCEELTAVAELVDAVERWKTEPSDVPRWPASCEADQVVLHKSLP
jgi:hypothetical protein